MLPLLFLALCVPAFATDYTGGDWAGADLILADGDGLSGVFTNVRYFEVPAGAQVTVRPKVPLEIHADEIVIIGMLDGDGAGHRGGASSGIGYRGKGPGGGQPGSWGEAGGGAGFGGTGGGTGPYCYYGSCSGGADGAPTYHPSESPMGSGGAGGAVHYQPRRAEGGHGGGSITLVADEVTIDGVVRARGLKGGCADYTSVFDSGGGGGGSGGHIRIDTDVLLGTGRVNVSGGKGGGMACRWSFADDFGGGGAGGWVVLVGSDATGLSVRLGGADGYQPGGDGVLSIDVDRDGLDAATEGSLGTDPANPDTDGDGQLDGVDLCPLDSPDDPDGDGLCG